jgi:hypothetical protein
MTPKQYEDWKRRRRLGRWRFVLFIGIAWAIPFATIFAVVFPVAIRGTMGDRLSIREVLLPALPVSLVGGIVFAFWMWSRLEAEYQDYKKGLIQYRDYCRSEGEDISLEDELRD